MARNDGTRNSNAFQREWAKLLEKMQEPAERFTKSWHDAYDLIVHDRDNKDIAQEIKNAFDSLEDGSAQQHAFYTWFTGPKNRYTSEIERYQKYQEDRKRISQMFEGEPDKQRMAVNMVSSQYQSGSSLGIQQADAEGGYITDVIEQLSGTFADGLSDMLFDLENFRENSRKLGQDLAQQFLKMTMDSMLKFVFTEEKVVYATDALNSTMNYAAHLIPSLGQGFVNLIKGLFGKGDSMSGGLGGLIKNIFSPKTAIAAAGAVNPAFSLVGSIFGGAGIFHSGGTVPQSANRVIPGTKEQLALLKGGERVLSPGENVQYENESSPPIVCLNMNVKAWDSKDVSKYFVENKNLIQRMVYDGIKSNNEGLRHMVESVRS